MIVDIFSNSVAAGARYDYTLDDVVDWIHEVCQE